MAAEILLSSAQFVKSVTSISDNVAGKQLIVLIGIVKGGEVNWITVPATANGDGTITVEITVAQLKMIEGADSLIFAIVTQ